MIHLPSQEATWRVYSCGAGYLGNLMWGCRGGAWGLIYCPENTTTAVTNESVEQATFLYTCVLQPSVAAPCVRWSVKWLVGWCPCKECVPHWNDFLARAFAVFTASFLFFRFPAEFLFLLWAVYLCYAVRTVPSAFHEPRYMAIAVHNELVLSAIFYIIR